MTMHQLVYRCPLDSSEITLNIEWPDWANMTPPADVVIATGDADPVCYSYNRTLS